MIVQNHVFGHILAKCRSMKDYIAKFEVLSAKARAKGIDLPESALAYHLLEFAGLDDDSLKLTKATIAELKYDEMKERLLKIFGDEVFASSSSSSVDAHSFEEVTVKTEPVYYGRNNNYRRGGGRGGRFGGRGGNWNSRGRGRGQQRPVTPAVTPSSGCHHHCSSKCHCVNVDKNQSHDVGFTENNTTEEKDEEEIILLQTKDYEEETLNCLVGETHGSAVVDSGCSKTVAGQRWLDVFEDTVGEQFKKGKSKNKFRFGKGGSVKSTGMVKLPIQLGDKSVING